MVAWNGKQGRAAEEARRGRWRVVRRTVVLHFVRGMAAAAGGATVTALLARLAAGHG
ncbi:hypothetical protein AB0E96_03740 [Kitasatospora sp. NPDC036755]|uniref:hypothetical protein n=1 Tax=Kitasatospora sp. NPDC036755 TaxID=3154600 RepID=UPI0034043D95